MGSTEEIMKCAVFIGTKDEGKFTPRASGFLVSTLYGDIGGFFYVVTAEHVIYGLSNAGKSIFVRMNTKEGSAADYEVPISEWHFHPDKSKPTDVAVSFLMTTPQPLDFRAVLLSGSSVLLRSELTDNLIYEGDAVSIVGLFRSHYGQDHNIPVVRTGHIASLNQEPVFTGYCGYTDAYLVETNSIAGLSGSPVFANKGDILHVESAAQLRKMKTGRFQLLGLMHGHFDVRNLNEDVLSDDSGVFKGGINTGIGVVIPVDKIIETIDQPVIEKLRNETMSKKKGKAAAT